LNISGTGELWGHPRLGASWEGFAIEQALTALRCREAYFWGTQGGAELDLLFFHGGKRYGMECKFNEAPKVSKSMHSALSDLSLTHLWVIYPGSVRYPAHERITMLPLAQIGSIPQELENER
jgi:predicted AAA+ superfamily ATPase